MWSPLWGLASMWPGMEPEYGLCMLKKRICLIWFGQGLSWSIFGPGVGAW